MRGSSQQGVGVFRQVTLKSLNLRLPAHALPIIVSETFQSSVLGMPLMSIIELDFAEICLCRGHTFEQIPA